MCLLRVLLYLIGGASFNIKRNLGYYNSRGKDLEDEILRIKRLRIEIDKCKDVMELMGIEGNIRKIYYSGWNKIVNQEINFEKDSNFYYIKEKGRKKVLQAYDERLKMTIKHKTLNRNVSYRHLIKLECYKLIKHLMEDQEYIPFEMWW